MRLDETEARNRFTQARVARLATVDQHHTPHLVPVTFAVLDAVDHADVVVFAVDHKPKTDRELRRLRNIRANPAVSFLVDHYEDDWAQLWWVRADADAHIDEAANHPEALHALAAKYPQYEAHTPGGALVRATVTTWRGWSATA